MAIASSPVSRANEVRLLEGGGVNDFVVASPEGAAPICVDTGDRAVERAASDLAGDIEKVAGLRPLEENSVRTDNGNVIIVGVVGNSPRIDALEKAGKLAVQDLRGKWESAVITTVEHPWPGVARALVVMGSDRRGAIYGTYWLSETFGVSPWAWWADVPVRHRKTIVVAEGKYVLAPPAVKYRGIFLNDEDWGLRPWAARTYDVSSGNIGPATYRRIFELILRLRGNLLWPAMHPGTRAFNFYPEDKIIADEYGIVMGSSHAEPMLRDNVDEWARDGIGEYNYVTNASEARRYWEKRVIENGHFENVYTLGMRGIHDGEMAGGGTIEERASRLRQIIAAQRALLAAHVSRDLAHVPQLFCPYKEVMDIYKNDPKIVPEDVTLLWPDDNFGYVQHTPTDQERLRSGGSGVYYHLSYWGRPYDYLWLCTTPPALVGEEMSKAFRYGARQIWVANVGDLKPAEWDMEFFLRLAWNPSIWTPSDGQRAYLRRVAERDFGSECAEEIASILDEYYRLNFQRRPEHVGIDPENRLLAQPVFNVGGLEAATRLEQFTALRQRAEMLGKKIGADYSAAYYELVLYPIRGSEAMNRKWINLERAQACGPNETDQRQEYREAAVAAQRQIDQDTETYNRRIANGRWNYIMSESPRDQAVFKMPAPGLARSNDKSGTKQQVDMSLSAENKAEQVSFAAANPARFSTGKLVTWRVVQGIGYTGKVLAAEPSEGAEKKSANDDGTSDYSFVVSHPGEWKISVRLLPTWSADPRRPARVAVVVDDTPPLVLTEPIYQDEYDVRWQRNVLRNAAIISTRLKLSPGKHVLKMRCVDADVLVDAILLQSPGGSNSDYFWPSDLEETKSAPQ